MSAEYSRVEQQLLDVYEGKQALIDVVYAVPARTLGGHAYLVFSPYFLEDEPDDENKSAPEVFTYGLRHGYVELGFRVYPESTPTWSLNWGLGAQMLMLEPESTRDCEDDETECDQHETYLKETDEGHMDCDGCPGETFQMGMGSFAGIGSDSDLLTVVAAVRDGLRNEFTDYGPPNEFYNMPDAQFLAKHHWAVGDMLMLADPLDLGGGQLIHVISLKDADVLLPKPAA